LERKRENERGGEGRRGGKTKEKRGGGKEGEEEVLMGRYYGGWGACMIEARDGRRERRYQKKGKKTRTRT